MKIYEISFSPTGGTQKVASIISQELGARISEIDLTGPYVELDPIHIESDDMAIVAMPTYGGRIPYIAKERFKQLEGNKAETILVTTYGNRAYEDTLIELYDIAVNREFMPIAAITAVTEHAIFPEISAGRPDDIDEERLRSFVRKIKAHKNYGRPRVPGSHPYREIEEVPLIPKKTRRCIQCGTCSDYCPVRAIDKETLEVTRSRCLSCMRCLKVCPQNARQISPMLRRMELRKLRKKEISRNEYELFLT